MEVGGILVIALLVYFVYAEGKRRREDRERQEQDQQRQLESERLDIDQEYDGLFCRQYDYLYAEAVLAWTGGLTDGVEQLPPDAQGSDKLRALATRYWEDSRAALDDELGPRGEFLDSGKTFGWYRDHKERLEKLHRTLSKQVPLLPDWPNKIARLEFLVDRADELRKNFDRDSRRLAASGAADAFHELVGRHRVHLETLASDTDEVIEQLDEMEEFDYA